MKANRRAVNKDDAVSPVIAVILMVAITVVLAATVYLWVSGFGSQQGSLVNASFTAKAIDLPWANTDADDSDDAIELTYTSGTADLSGNDTQIFLDGTPLNWSSVNRNFEQVTSGAWAAGNLCTNNPGADADDIWERGMSVYLIDTVAGATVNTECDGSVASGPTNLDNLGTLDALHLLKVVVKGQVVLDTSIEVHDNAGA